MSSYSFDSDSELYDGDSDFECPNSDDSDFDSNDDNRLDCKSCQRATYVTLAKHCGSCSCCQPHRICKSCNLVPLPKGLRSTCHSCIDYSFYLTSRFDYPQVSEFLLIPDQVLSQLNLNLDVFNTIARFLFKVQFDSQNFCKICTRSGLKNCSNWLCSTCSDDHRNLLCYCIYCHVRLEPDRPYCTCRFDFQNRYLF